MRAPAHTRAANNEDIMPKDNENTATGSGQRNETGRTPLASRTNEVVDEVRQATLGRVESVRASAQSAKEQAAEKVRHFGQTVRKVGEHIAVEDHHYLADKATDASQRLESIADYISGADVARLLRDTRELSRRNPTVFYGASLVIGFAAGRFLKGISTGSEAPSRARALPERASKSGATASKRANESSSRGAI